MIPPDLATLEAQATPQQREAARRYADEQTSAECPEWAREALYKGTLRDLLAGVGLDGGSGRKAVPLDATARALYPLPARQPPRT